MIDRSLHVVQGSGPCTGSNTDSMTEEILNLIKDVADEKLRGADKPLQMGRATQVVKHGAGRARAAMSLVLLVVVVCAVSGASAQAPSGECHWRGGHTSQKRSALGDSHYQVGMIIMLGVCALCTLCALRSLLSDTAAARRAERRMRHRLAGVRVDLRCRVRPWIHTQRHQLRVQRQWHARRCSTIVHMLPEQHHCLALSK